MAIPLFSPRISTKALAGLCHRVGTSIEAGVDIRKVLVREVERTTGLLARHLTMISKAVDDGQSFGDALAETDDFFPPIFREMVEVGEQTGHLDAVLLQLADHYEVRCKMRRNFLAAIAWPVIQLGLALGIVGFLIWITGMLQVDILGLGLTGDRGLRIYLVFLAVVGAAAWLVLLAVGRGLVWTRPIQRAALALPIIGRPLQTMALARLAWSIHLTMNTGMDVRRALRLSLRSAQNARYIDQIPAIDAEIVAGSSIHEAFVEAGGYPADFLDTLAVGEQSGKVVESMGMLARQYQERAKMAMTLLAGAAGLAVWALVAAFIIVLIFRMAFFYVGQIYDAMPP